MFCLGLGGIEVQKLILAPRSAAFELFSLSVVIADVPHISMVVGCPGDGAHRLISIFYSKLCMLLWSLEKT